MDTAIQTIKNRYPLSCEPYFKALAEGTFERNDFIETQIQFFHAVAWFPRAMSHLLPRLQSSEARLGILDNISEEYGTVGTGHAHVNTFQNFLASLRVPATAIDSRVQWPEVRTFNLALSGAGSYADCSMALAALGMIEDLFSGISEYIAKAMVERGWLTEQMLHHYSVHASLDIEHAGMFYRCVKADWNRGRQHQASVSAGLELGASLLMQLYRNLYENRKRRWTLT